MAPKSVRAKSASVAGTSAPIDNAVVLAPTVAATVGMARITCVAPSSRVIAARLHPAITLITVVFACRDFRCAVTVPNACGFTATSTRQASVSACSMGMVRSPAAFASATRARSASTATMSAACSVPDRSTPRAIADPSRPNPMMVTALMWAL